MSILGATTRFFLLEILGLENYWKFSPLDLPIFEAPSRRLVLRCNLRWLIGPSLKRALILLLAAVLEAPTHSVAWLRFLLEILGFFTSTTGVLLLIFFSLLTGDGVCLLTPHCKLLVIWIPLRTFLRVSVWLSLTFLLFQVSFVESGSKTCFIWYDVTKGSATKTYHFDEPVSLYDFLSYCSNSTKAIYRTRSLFRNRCTTKIYSNLPTKTTNGFRL